MLLINLKFHIQIILHSNKYISEGLQINLLNHVNGWKYTSVVRGACNSLWLNCIPLRSVFSCLWLVCSLLWLVCSRLWLVCDLSILVCDSSVVLVMTGPGGNLNNSVALQTDSTAVNVNSCKNKVVLLQTAKACACNLNETKKSTLRMLLDSGSQRTFLNENVK